MSTKVNGEVVLSMPEFAVLAFFTSVALLPLLEVATIYEAGRRAGQAQAARQGERR